jgi:hypothetical protein
MHNHNSGALLRDPALKAAARMPLLDHFHHGRTFDIMESDVCAWLIEQPEIRQSIFNYCKRHGALLYVDGKWVGAATYTKLNELTSRPD